MKKKIRLLEIDSLRGVAALSVLFFHFNFKGVTVLKYGCLGVDLFFMISGFVMLMSIKKANSLKKFLLARFNRLFPTYWLSLIIAVVSYLIFSRFSLIRPLSYFLGNFFMLQPLFKTTNLVDAYWTLYVELVFYAFVSIMWTMRLLNKIELIVWVGLFIMFLLNGIYVFFPYNTYYNRLFIVARSIIPLVCFFNFFAAGMVFHQIRDSGINLNRILLLCFCFATIALVHGISGRAFYYLGITEHLLVDLLFYLVFILIVMDKSNFLNNRFLLFFGAISYPLYLIHESVGLSFYLYFIKHTNYFSAMLVGITISILIAIIINYRFEIPVHRWIKSKYSK